MQAHALLTFDALFAAAVPAQGTKCMKPSYTHATVVSRLLGGYTGRRPFKTVLSAHFRIEPGF